MTETNLKPNYEFSSPELETIIEGMKEKYDIKLEKFYNKQHLEDFCKLISQGESRERFWTLGTFLASWGGLFGLAISLIPYPGTLAGGFGFLATAYGSFLTGIFVSDTLLPLYEKLSSKILKRDYKTYCKDNNIPYENI